MEKEPRFPITVKFHEDDETWTLLDLNDAACNLEWFDSDDGQAEVIDSEGRPVRLKVQALEVVVCELEKS
jgi:hypothetical protein